MDLPNGICPLTKDLLEFKSRFFILEDYRDEKVYLHFLRAHNVILVDAV